MNNVSLVGRLTKDVDLRYTPTGTAVGRFTLAVNRRVVNDKGVREADFISCIAWNKPAETLANYTSKGSLLAVQGRMQTGSYENQEGQRVYTTDVVVESYTFVESAKKENATKQPETFNDRMLNAFEEEKKAKENFSAFEAVTEYEPFTNDYGISEDDLPF